MNAWLARQRYLIDYVLAAMARQKGRAIGLWVVYTLLGTLAGGLITDVKPFALDYALPAMFIALLILQIKGNRYLLVAAVAGVLSIGIWLVGVTQWNVLLATLIAATLGAGVETWTKRQ